MKRYILYIALFLCHVFASAQIVKTAGEPGKHIMGFVDKDGNWVGEHNYYYTYWDEFGQFGLFGKDNYEIRGMVNRWGKVVLPCKYKGVWGLFNSKGRVYQVSVEASNGKKTWGVITENGAVIVPLEFDMVVLKEGLLNESDMVYGVISINQKGKKGFTDLNGRVILPCIYDDVRCQYHGILLFKQKGKEGCCDINGRVMVPLSWGCDEVNYKYNDEKILYYFPKKGNVEGAVDADGKVLIPLSAGYNKVRYAADNIFLVKRGKKYGYFANGEVIIPCEYDEATAFEKNVATVKKDGQVKLIKNPLVDGSDIQIAENTIALNKKVKGPVVSRYPAPNSEVDKNIPAISADEDAAKFAFIIANENYPDAPVPYALNDGRMFREYCHKTFGIPEKHIYMLEDATYGNIVSTIEQLKEIANAYDGEASVILYYAGHGVPDEKNNSAYLLPIDGSSTEIETTGYSLAKLYADLAQLNLRSTTVFLDACFSGAKREDDMLIKGRGVAVKVKEEAPKGNMVVFSASTGDETAHQLEEKHHGLFTYYILKKLQETKGNATIGELSDYVTKNVKRQSVVINSKKQTPTVIPAPGVGEEWRKWKLR